MKTLGIFFLMSLSVASYANTQNECPNLDGKFMSLPTKYSTFTTGYSFEHEISKDNVLVYHVQEVYGPNANDPYDLTVDSEVSGDTGTIGHATEKVFCKNNKLIIRQYALGVVEEKNYGLDGDNNLLVGHGSGVGGIVLPHGDKIVYPRN